MLLTSDRSFRVCLVCSLALLLAIAASMQPQRRRRLRHRRRPPPAGVSILTLETKADRTTLDFIATLRSLRSTTVQPEGEGIVTKIFVKAGDRVRAGAPLVQINADKQQAAVRSAEANRAGTEADVEYWRQQVKRFESLVGPRARSASRSSNRRRTRLRTAEAQLAALDAQVREGRVAARLLPRRRAAGRHRRRHPRSRRRPRHDVDGDHDDRRQTRDSRRTSRCRSSVARAPLGLPVQLLDRDGKVIATNPITFVAPRVDDATQSVLVKSALQHAAAGGAVCSSSCARASSGRTGAGRSPCPVSAVTRISGQYFCFVAEPGPTGRARRAPEAGAGRRADRRRLHRHAAASRRASG